MSKFNMYPNLSIRFNSFLMLLILFALFLSCKETPASGTKPESVVPVEVPASAGSNETAMNTTPPKPKGKANITFKINGLGTGTAQIAGIYADQNFLADTARIQPGGIIKLKKDSLYMPGMYFVVMPNQQNFQLLLDADQEFEMTADLSDIINTMKVTGSVDNELLYQSLKMQYGQDKQLQPMQQKAAGKPDTDPDAMAYKKMNEEVRLARKKQLEEFTNQHPNSFFVKFKRAGQNPEVRDIKLPNGQPDIAAQGYYFRQEYWNTTDLGDQRLMYTPVMANKIKQYFTDITPQHQDSIIKQADFLLSRSLANPDLFKYLSNYLLFKYEPGKTTLMDGEAVFSFITGKYYNATNCPWLKPGDLQAIKQRGVEMSGSLLNKKALDVVAKDPFGATKSIYGIKSPYIVVYLFHTDCEHCQEYTPKLSKIYPQLKSRGVEIFTIAVNTTDAEWKKFIPKYGMTNFTNVFDPTNVAVYGKYFVDNTPEIYVLNKDRIIIGKNLKVEQINTILDMDQKK